MPQGNVLCKNRFCGLQMVQFECFRVVYSLVSFTFGVHCEMPFSQYAGKGKFRMCLVNEGEMYSAKIGFVDCKWSNLNAPGSTLGAIYFWCQLSVLF